jgi:hypothetical protein
VMETSFCLALASLMSANSLAEFCCKIDFSSAALRRRTCRGALALSLVDPSETSAQRRMNPHHLLQRQILLPAKKSCWEFSCRPLCLALAASRR